MDTQNTDLQASDIAVDSSDDVAADTSGEDADISGDGAEVTDISETLAHADVTDAAQIQEIGAAIAVVVKTVVAKSLKLKQFFGVNGSVCQVFPG